MSKVVVLGLALACATFCVSPAVAQMSAAKTAAEVRAADEAFEHRVQVAGVSTGFREFMDEKDGLQFNGGPPDRGAEAIAKAALINFGNTHLTWQVVDAWGSKGGDMGVTTGNWQATGEKGAPNLTGRYVTVWRKNPAGVWKGLIDIGAPDPMK